MLEKKESRRYKAFISYSHTADGKLAPAIQSGLHRLAKPWYRLRAMRVFRDKTDLAVNPGLWSSIERALDESEYFLLLASPQAAKSPWVQREIDYWLNHRSADQILILQTDGKLVWNSSNHDFDWEKTDALPKKLQNVFEEEPHCPDLRWARTAEDLSLRHPQFRDVVAGLTATIQNREKDELIGEDVRQHRKTIQLVWTACIVLLILSIWALYERRTAQEERDNALRQERIAKKERDNAFQQERIAKKERDNALRQERIARSRELSFAALGQLEVDTELSLLLSRAAITSTNRDDEGIIPEAEKAFHRALVTSWTSVDLLHIDQPINSGTFSPDGALIAVSTGENVNIYDSKTLRVSKNRVPSHQGVISKIVFSPSGHVLMTADFQGKVTMVDLSDGKARELEARGGAGPMRSVDAFCDIATLEGGFIVTGLRQSSYEDFVVDKCVTLRCFDIEGDSTKYYRRLPFVGPCPVAVNSGEEIIATGGRDEDRNEAVIHIWNTSTGEQVSELKGHVGPIRSLAFHPEVPNLLFSGSEDHTILAWNVSDKRTFGAPLIGHTGPVIGLSITSDGLRLASAGSDKTVRIWSIMPPFRQLSVLRGFNDEVNQVSFEPNGSRFLTVSKDGCAKLWQEAAVPPSEVIHIEGEVRGLAIHPKGTRFIVANGGETLKEWRIDSVKINQEIEIQGGSVWGVAYHPDGSQIACAGLFPRTFDLKTKEELVFLLHIPEGWDENPKPQLTKVVYSSTGKWLGGINTNGDFVLLNAQTGRKVFEPVHLTEKLFDVASSKTDSCFAVGGIGGAWAFHPSSQNPFYIYSLPFVTDPTDQASVSCIAVSPDENRIALGTNKGNITVVNIQENQEVFSIQGHEGPVLEVTFSPDGRYIGSAGSDRTAMVWDASTGELVMRLGHHFKPVTTIAFTPNGKRVLTGSEDGKVSVYDLDIVNLIKYSMSISSRQFTPMEKQKYYLK